MKRNIICVIMGGGRGERLYPLTKDRCKPAVPLAGKYRLIDIPISNCLNSKLNRIHILTQFNTASLHNHIQSAYQFDSFGGGFVDILSAEQTSKSDSWYSGTADAVRHNLHHFHHEPDDIFIILSGDQLYRIDLRDIIAHHLKVKAEVTITAKPIPSANIGAFGAMQIDPKYRIERFVEKPQRAKQIESLTLGEKISKKIGLKSPEYCLASMGIYVFNARALHRALQGPGTDFGKHILPDSVQTGKLFAYPFNSYWADIGTIKSFFETSLSLSEPQPPFNFFDPKCPIYTLARHLPDSKIQNSKLDSVLLNNGSIIENSNIQRSIIGMRSHVRSNCTLHETILAGADFYEAPSQKHGSDHAALGIGENTKITRTIIDKNARIGKNVELNPAGKPDGWSQKGLHVSDGILVVLKNAVIPDNTKIIPENP